MKADWERTLRALANETGAEDEEAFVQACRALAQDVEDRWEEFKRAAWEKMIEDTFVSISSGVSKMSRAWDPDAKSPFMPAAVEVAHRDKEIDALYEAVARLMLEQNGKNVLEIKTDGERRYIVPTQEAKDRRMGMKMTK